MGQLEEDALKELAEVEKQMKELMANPGDRTVDEVLKEQFGLMFMCIRIDERYKCIKKLHKIYEEHKL